MKEAHIPTPLSLVLGGQFSESYCISKAALLGYEVQV